jgi:hypothetical protein
LGVPVCGNRGLRPGEEGLMPMVDFTDEEMQSLTLVLANASGPGVNWVTTNALLTKLQQAAQNHPLNAQMDVKASRRRHVPPGDGLDLEPPVS